MQTKTFEIRDSGTFIPVLATKMRPDTEQDRYLFGRTGYGLTADEQAKYVIVVKIDGSGFGANYDPYSWPGGARTMREAHHYIIDKFDELESGAVIDVQFILGETESPKTSEAMAGALAEP